jgi:hypothetical protein
MSLSIEQRMKLAELRIRALEVAMLEKRMRAMDTPVEELAESYFAWAVEGAPSALDAMQDARACPLPSAPEPAGEPAKPESEDASAAQPASPTQPAKPAAPASKPGPAVSARR